MSIKLLQASNNRRNKLFQFKKNNLTCSNMYILEGTPASSELQDMEQVTKRWKLPAKVNEFLSNVYAECYDQRGAVRSHRHYLSTKK